MRARPQSIIVSVVARTFVLSGLVLVCWVTQSAAENPGNIICRGEVSTVLRDELATRLRAITGWQSLKFDNDGKLQIGTTAPVGGSVTARQLISKAFSSNTIIILEDTSNRADVVFSRVVTGRWKQEALSKLPVFVVLIDFADFDRLMGDRPAREAFNVGWGVLHEMDHVVNDSIDADRLGLAGECEDHINQMRRECHLPVRSDYFFTFFPHAEEREFKARLVRLAFDQEDGISKRRRYWLIWDATQVGGLAESKQIATLR